MLFTSPTFLQYFLPAFLALYYVTPGRWRSFTLAFASYVFYGWWRPDFLILIFVSTVVDYTVGSRIHRAGPRTKRAKRWLLLSLAVNLGLLAYFKYANFGIETLNSLLAGMGHDAVYWTEVVLPVGISFYTFQTLSYSIDVYRGTSQPVDRFRDFLCYVAMFPQLVAGPIVRYNTIADQLREREHSVSGFHQGVLAFQAGLIKKVLIADTLGGVADAAFASEALGVGAAWVGALAYTFQIYFDFSGYSDMAIGLGLMIGFRLPINFDGPYRSRSITEFWRRWHISLSTFLRDYLYVPLGGNRKGPVRTYINLCLVMLLGGLWHGAAWTFVAWGAYQGFWLVVERLSGRRSLYERLPDPARVLLTFVLVVFGWVLFRAESLGDAGTYLGHMVGVGAEGATIASLVRPIHLLAFAAAILLVWAAPTTQSLIKKGSSSWGLALQPLFVISVIHLHFVDHVPFLYFQF